MIDTVTHHWPVFGHDWAVEQLRKSIAFGRVRHAYLITGADSVGKNTLAHAFAMALNCTHPDENERPCGQCRSCKLIYSGNHPDMLYSEVDENTGALKIEAIRNVTRGLAMKPFEARYRVALFPYFDRAQPRAQDALLKTLEEPPPTAVLILLARSTEALLSTITSRSQVINLRPVPLVQVRDVLIEHFQVEGEQAELLARLSGGRIGWAIQAAHEPHLLEQRENALNLLENSLDWTRAERFNLAQDLGRDKLVLAEVLELWQTYWRDLVLLKSGDTRVKVANTDRSVQLQRLSLAMTEEEALRALRVTRELLHNLSYNLNLRLALETLFLDYPGLKHE
ncbi:MAG: DNA polymerase III subunit [Anaerolineae bacterium]|nr:DNA polymerase III subunit [Anaerolineae bacterium]